MLLADPHKIHSRHLAALRRSAHMITFYGHAIRQLAPYMQLQGEVPDADHVTRATILGYQEWLRVDRKLKPGGEHAALRGLRATFRWALEEEMIRTDPTVKMRLPSLPHEQPPAIQPAEVELCLKMAKQGRHPLRDTAIIYTLYDTGLRRGELIKLKISDVDMNAPARLGRHHQRPLARACVGPAAASMPYWVIERVMGRETASWWGVLRAWAPP